MLDKIHNIIIYAHFACNHFRNKSLGFVTKDIDFNKLLEHEHEYLQEKVDKYLSKEISVTELNHNEIVIMWFNKPSVNSLGALIEYFMPLIDKIKTTTNLLPKTELIDSSGSLTGITDQFFTVHGADYSVIREIESYMHSYSEEVWEEVIRDSKIQNIIQ
jgi:hypothetical protein